MNFSRLGNIFVVLIMSAVLTFGMLFAMKKSRITFAVQPAAVSIAQNETINETAIVEPGVPQPPPPPQKLSNPPEIIKAVYVTGYSAGSKRYLNYLTNLFETTEINAVVIDIKDYSGLVSYKSDAPEVKKYNLYNGAIYDINALVEFLHKQNIYVIGRIAVFEDPGYSRARPELAVYNKEKTLLQSSSEAVAAGQVNLVKPILWKDNKGLSWMDPASKEVWDYNISIAKDVLAHGFDEINFDYIRFPSDGNTSNIGFPIYDGQNSLPTGRQAKAEIIKEFFIYLRSQLQDEKISVDLFGLTTVKTDDLGVGQIIEDAFLNFDYVSPMVYPSHYANGFIGFANPAEYPYEVVKYSMNGAKNRETAFLNNISEATGSPAAESKSLDPVIKLAKFRPWLQDFDMGADYTAEMVRREIKATQDSLGGDYVGFMLWSPSNIYTQDAIIK